MNTLTETNVRLIASPRMWMEGEAVRQLYATAKLGGVRLAVGFPDLHPGKGTPVGAAFVTEGVVYPHLIGGDIGCGMTLLGTDLLRRKAKLDRWAELNFGLEHPWTGRVGGWLQDNQLPSTRYDDAMGTIGGGNHFAELQTVERVHDAAAFKSLKLDREKLVLLVHSGSRGLGESILWDHAVAHGAAGLAPESGIGTAYLRAHDNAVRWARANRELIGARFLDTLGAGGKPIWDGCHNSITRIGTEPRWLHRKGTAPSGTEAVVIPGSRGTLSYLVKPLTDDESHAWSLAHGAGRKWARSAARLRARERHSLSEMVQTPLGGRVVCEERDLLYEEAPMAYKPVESVIESLEQEGLVKVVATFRPLLTYKTCKLRR